jgi:hypothetical protein
LDGLVDPDAAVVKAGIVHDDNGYRLDADPRTVIGTGTPLQEAFALRGPNVGWPAAAEIPWSISRTCVPSILAQLH